jgi:ABC-type uncharacterized transport system auxiliary subunit
VRRCSAPGEHNADRVSDVRRAAMAISLLLGATGCISVDIGESGGQVQAQYRLLDYASPAERRSEPIDRTLVVTQMPSAGIGDVYSMAYSREPQQRAFYQYATWVDRPSVRVAQLLAERIEARGMFRSVAMLGHGVGGNVLINITINDIVHDVAATAGRIEVTVELIDRVGRRLIERRRFAALAPVAQEDAPGAVAALSRALTRLLDEIVPWVEQHAEQLPPAAPREGRGAR